MPVSGSQEGMEIWPSRAWAEWLYHAANIVLVASLGVGLAATWLVVWMSSVKERYAAVDASTASAEIARAGARSDEANARAAEANARAAEANEKAEHERVKRLELEQRLAPRALSLTSTLAIRQRLGPFSGNWLDVFIFPDGSADILPLSQAIMNTATSSGWMVRAWTAMGGSRFVSGIVISVRDDSDTEVMKAATALRESLSEEGIVTFWEPPFKTGELTKVGVAAVTGPDWNEKVVAPIRMLIGTKP
jgi:hypothetical protein